jgi:hypothetical protein
MSKYFIWLLSIIIVFQHSYSKKEIITIDDFTFGEALQNSTKTYSKLFIIFYTYRCPYCSHCIKVLKEQVIKNYEDTDRINFGLVNLNEPGNLWIGIRFNITKIPYIILIEENRMYTFNEQFEESAVLQFINEEKFVEDSLEIPQEVGYFRKLKLFVNELTKRIQIKFHDLFKKYGINFKWNNTMTYGLLISIVIFIIYFENKLIVITKNLWEKSNDKDNLNENENKSEKKEEKEEKENKENKENKDKNEDKDKNKIEKQKKE